MASSFYAVAGCRLWSDDGQYHGLGYFTFSLFGSLIALLEKSGGALGSRFAVKITKTRKISLIVTWILGIIVFIDDYLNALAVGSVMRQVTTTTGFRECWHM